MILHIWNNVNNFYPIFELWFVGLQYIPRKLKTWYAHKGIKVECVQTDNDVVALQSEQNGNETVGLLSIFEGYSAR